MSDIETLKQIRFTPEDRDERITRSLAALNQPCSINLSPEQWREVVEADE